MRLLKSSPLTLGFIASLKNKALSKHSYHNSEAVRASHREQVQILQPRSPRCSPRPSLSSDRLSLISRSGPLIHQPLMLFVPLALTMNTCPGHLFLAPCQALLHPPSPAPTNIIIPVDTDPELLLVLDMAYSPL